MDGAKEDLREWSRRWREYREWADANGAPDRRPPQAIMRDLETLYGGFSEDVRRTDPDPEKLGIQDLHRIFRLLSAQ